VNKYSHIDLRVDAREKVRAFDEHLLPALGFTRTFHSERWKVFAAEGDLPDVPYFAGSTKRRVKGWGTSPSSSNRTCGFPAYGFPTFFTLRNTYFATWLRIAVWLHAEFRGSETSSGSTSCTSSGRRS